MKKIAKILQFKVLLEQDEDGLYVASVPELPGCYTQAKTLEEVRKRIREAIELVLNKIRPSLQADGGNVELVDVTAGTVKVTGTDAGPGPASFTARSSTS